MMNNKDGKHKPKKKKGEGGINNLHSLFIRSSCCLSTPGMPAVAFNCLLHAVLSNPIIP